MDNPWYGEADVYCQAHAPDGAMESVGSNEVDSPIHCSVCHTPLECSLTTDGVEYVVEALRAELSKGRAGYLEVHKCYNGTYYQGEPHVSILWDWVDLLGWVRPLGDVVSKFVWRFSSWTHYQWDKKKGERK